MAGADDVVKLALKMIAGGAKEAGPSVAERAAKNLDVFNTANRLGVDTNDIAKLQETKRLMDYHKGFMGDVRERAKSANEIVQQMKASGAFPMEIGTRYTTEHSRRTGQAPWTVTNYYVDPKNPQGSYGYYVRRELPDGGYEESVSKIRDPKLEAMHGPEKWEELQRGFVPMTGPKVVKAYGGSIREGYGPGGWVDDVVKMAGKAIMGEGEKVAPVSRIGMNYKDVTKRVPELTEAAKRLQAGEIGQSEYSAMVDRFKPVEPYASVPNPASVDDMVRALTANKREKIGKLADYPEGHPVALRLDIPAYTGHGVWVPTIHDQKTFKSISHEPAAHIAGAQFSIPENKALAVAAGGAKGPFATIDGSLLKTPPEAIHERAKAAMNDPDWVQVGMDPERHSYFYDRKTMQPVISAEEVIQVGPLVLARKPVYGNAEGFKYSKGGSISRPQRSMGGNNSISGALNVARGLNGGE
jgi:hypothetical protein